ncbi:hypothetical protein L596_023853 [Steinernema carpocapsae]|uniref:Uncharacterized protein n=1 Tax=Steinernema carpocapsae TaxID=34508 RepID=A0A4U5MFN9_STECR|nr:hypothetical protein L596_023853 [Steinernema carpocapsae]
MYSKTARFERIDPLVVELKKVNCKDQSPSLHHYEIVTLISTQHGLAVRFLAKFSKTTFPEKMDSSSMWSYHSPTDDLDLNRFLKVPVFMVRSSGGHVTSGMRI